MAISYKKNIDIITRISIQSQRMVGRRRIEVIGFSLGAMRTPLCIRQASSITVSWLQQPSASQSCSMSTQVSPTSFLRLVLRVGSSTMGLRLRLEGKAICCPGSTFTLPSWMAGAASLAGLSWLLISSKASPSSFCPNHFFSFLSSSTVRAASEGRRWNCLLSMRSSFFLLSSDWISSLRSSFSLSLQFCPRLTSSLRLHFCSCARSSFSLRRHSPMSQLCDFSFAHSRPVTLARICSRLVSLGRWLYQDGAGSDSQAARQWGQYASCSS